MSLRIMPSSVYSFANKVVVITGGASGIGLALAQSLATKGSRIAVLDRSSLCSSVAQSLFGHSHRAYLCDVTNAPQMEQTIRKIKNEMGPIDIYVSNAGIISTDGDPLNDAVSRFSDQQWRRIFDVNVLSHVIATRILLPDWERGIGDAIFIVTASAAGLLAQIGDTSYGVTKAAAVSFAEHTAITHPKLQVHCLCPQAVDTPFIRPLSRTNAPQSAATDGIITAEYCAKCTVEAIVKGRKGNNFLILPHATVSQYSVRKAQDPDRWLKGMQRLRIGLQRKYQDSDSKL